MVESGLVLLAKSLCFFAETTLSLSVGTRGDEGKLRGRAHNRRWTGGVDGGERFRKGGSERARRGQEVCSKKASSSMLL